MIILMAMLRLASTLFLTASLSTKSRITTSCKIQMLNIPQLPWKNQMRNPSFDIKSCKNTIFRFHSKLRHESAKKNCTLFICLLFNGIRDESASELRSWLKPVSLFAKMISSLFYNDLSTIINSPLKGLRPGFCQQFLHARKFATTSF